VSVAEKAKYAAKRGASRLKRHAEKTVSEFEWQIEYYQKLRRDLFDKLSRMELSGPQVAAIRKVLERGKDKGLSPAECEKLLTELGKPEKRKMTPTEARRIDELNNKIRGLEETILPYMLPKLASMEFKPDDETASALLMIRAKIAGEVIEGKFEDVSDEVLLLP